MSVDPRDAELADALAAVRLRVEAACAAARRVVDEVTLVVVTKTYPAADVVRLAGLGVTDAGEARHPEAGRKADEVARAGVTGVRWHFVGAVQTNKAAAVARYSDVVHSVDRARLVSALERGAARAQRTLDCLVQVDLDESAAGGGRSGAHRDDVPALADAVDGCEHLRLRGLMAVAPLAANPAAAFARLAEVAADLAAGHPAARWVSAGMSADLEHAVAAGATHLRVGRAVLGERPPLH